MFDENKLYIIDGPTLRHMIAICRKLSDENPSFKQSMKDAVKMLLTLDIIDEIRDMNDIDFGDVKDLAFQIGIDLERLDKLSDNLLEGDYKKKMNKKAYTLDDMLKNVGLKLRGT
tara:strand:- start:401 stop:745 length:345 start_codon:yes stop_codon:yes gene_type:complete